MLFNLVLLIFIFNFKCLFTGFFSIVPPKCFQDSQSQGWIFEKFFQNNVNTQFLNRNLGHGVPSKQLDAASLVPDSHLEHSNGI
jgi:hypothetical protein